MKRLIITISVLFCVALSLNLVAQDSASNRDKQHIIDSLKKVIADVEKQCSEPCAADTGRIAAYLTLGEYIYMHEPDSAVNLWILAERIGEVLIENISNESIIKKANKYLASALNNVGYITWQKGYIKEALEYYNRSLKIRSDINDKIGIGETYTNIGLVFFYQSNIPKTLEYWKKGLEIYTELGDKQGETNIINNLGALYYNQGDISNALKYHNRSLLIKQEIGDVYGIAQSYNNIGIIYDQIGESQKALEYYRNSSVLQKEINDKLGLATSLNNIGNSYYEIGDIASAIEYVMRSLSIREQIGNKYEIAQSLNSIGAIYGNQGDDDKALEYYNRSYIIREEIGDKKGIIQSLNSIGNLYNLQSNTEEALNVLKKCQALSEEIGDKQSLLETMRRIGYTYEIRGDLNRALECYKKSLAISREVGDQVEIAKSLSNLAYIYHQKSDLPLFEKYSDKCSEISHELGFPKRVMEALTHTKCVNIYKENYEKSDSLAFKILEITNRSLQSNFVTLPESGQEKYINMVAENFMDFNSYALYRKGNYASIADVVYNSAIRNKGMLLRSSCAMRNAVLNSNDSTLTDNYYNWITLKKQITKGYSIGKNVDSLENIAVEFEKQLIKKSEIFSEYKSNQQITLNDIKNNLQPHEVAIEFIHFKYRNYSKVNFWNWQDTVIYCALIIKPDTKHPIMISLFEEEQLQEILYKFSGNNYNYINSIYGNNTDVNTKLYDIIWKPMEEYLKDANTVYLSPTGLLHKVSFAALCMEQNVYLCDNYNIEMKSSTGKLASPEYFLFSDTMKATLFGGINYNSDSTQNEIWKYLTGTKSEIEKIKSIFIDGNIEVNNFVDSSATEKEFKEIATLSNILHISTHGFFFPDPKELREAKRKAEESGKEFAESRASRSGEYGIGVDLFVKNPNPLWRSGLVFAGANDIWNKGDRKDGEDGILTAQEVSHLDLRETDLVVMSACETGLGDIRGSEGVYGLQRAFKMAGVKYLIMSLWQVADKETEEFMTTFYSKLLDLKDIHKAFSETQKEMRQKYDPYFWAAFVLVE